MPRQRTPFAVAEASGAVEKNPQRFESRRLEPIPSGKLGDPPLHLSAAQRALWVEVAARVPEGVLTSADCYILEIAVTLLEKLRLGDIKPVEIGHLRASLGSMGLTPADRSRVTGSNEPKEDDPLAILGGSHSGYAN